jgi:hypothetical protein
MSKTSELGGLVPKITAHPQGTGAHDWAMTGPRLGLGRPDDSAGIDVYLCDAA